VIESHLMLSLAMLRTSFSAPSAIVLPRVRDIVSETTFQYGSIATVTPVPEIYDSQRLTAVEMDRTYVAWSCSLEVLCPNSAALRMTPTGPAVVLTHPVNLPTDPAQLW